ncbi:MAG: enoyl-CoA hydratase/isomerase family protein [Dehalococcoidia bacterium]|nr:MAG: enoyl-CoA hydratase/isomerase family protein [Dehalococcoidia bacterium]
MPGEMMKFEVEKKDNIAVLTINRPETLNAMTSGPRTGPYERSRVDYDKYWRGLFQDLKYDPDVRVVVITGAGDKSFSSGADIKDWGARELEWKKAGRRPPKGTVIEEGTTQPFLFLRALHKPSIAAVNGLAVGMGADLALACDMRIASEKAWFWWAYILRGMVPMDGACWLLPRLVGQAKALQILMTGQKVYAEEALRLGIVNEVVPHEQLLDKTMEIAMQIANGPWAAIQLLRYTVYCAERQSFQETLDLSMLCANLEQETIAEGMIAAGVEKRQADFEDK